MLSDTDDSVASPVKAAPKPAKNGKVEIEKLYQKKSQLEHILLRPDTYIGSIENETKLMWVWDVDEEGKGKMVNREISYVPGLYKIFDEILVNAADNKQRDSKMSMIKVTIDTEKNEITIFNDGEGIPVVEHKKEKIWVPTMIFGHLLTSSNYDDDEKKVVGGRNGYGAKLCNIFSKKFKIETSSKSYGKAFSQTWSDNMSKAGEPKITSAIRSDFTKITFIPDLTKFKLQELTKDIVALFSRRAYDVAGSSKGVKVYLNGDPLPVKGFKEYVQLFLKDREDDNGNPLKTAFEVVNDRWEVACTVSDKGFQQNSFVNSIATTRGGKHVDYVADQVIKQMSEIIKKKNKGGASVKPFQIRNHMWIFVNCLIENPTFDSQTKETMTLQTKNFGSKCIPSEKFMKAATNIGVVDSVLTWVKFKAQTELSKMCHSKKHSKLTGIPKLEDANDAGTKNSIDCTLILTEGDSAKSLVVAGLGVVGRDKYGVFPLRGKLLNVREASHKQILENAEINNIIKIVGLQYKKSYDSPEDLKSLRYGKIMIMTDQDQDGSHIKGLLVNFIHHNWPSLLKLNFLEEFITPIVKATKGNICHSFYSLPEFEEWKMGTENWKNFRVKYYKGLGTSTAAEAKEYFTDMDRHRIQFKYSGEQDDHHVRLAFSKKMIEARKDWLTKSMEDKKQRKELNLPEEYLYEKNTKSVTYTDFVNKELILFSNMDNVRSIPSLVDGLKPGQRKVLFTCFKRNDKREVKVAQLAGSVGEHSAYHHGEASLMSTIINLAQNFVGSNNINLLQPIGQFGTRLAGGKDSASPRYIFTMLSTLSRKLFSSLDDPLLNYLYDDNLKIEPDYYIPIIPMVLVNGAEGIGTGWSTKIPNFNPRELVENVRRMIRGDEPKKMNPWYKGFTGSIEQIDTNRYVCNGEAAVLDEESFEITELPVKTWTETYKESVLRPMVSGTEKTSAYINDFKEYHTDATVKFVIQLDRKNLRNALDSNLHKTFKIQSTFTTSSMVLFDANGCLRRYDSPEEILREFFPLRLQTYIRRKAYYEGILEAEASKLENQARFILEKNEGKIKMENIKKKDFLSILIQRGYDSDPVKEWKKKNAEKIDDEEEEREEPQDDIDKKYDYDYLIDMSMRSMLREKVQELLKQRDEKKTELERLRKSTPQDLWEADLEAFSDELDKVENAEREELYSNTKAIMSKLGKKNKAAANDKRSKKAKPINMDDFKPSADAERVEPKIELETLKKAVAAGKKKVKDETKDEMDVDILIDDNSQESSEMPMVSLADRIAAHKANGSAKKEPKEKVKKAPKEKVVKEKAPKKLKTSPAGKGKKKKDEFSDTSDEASEPDLGFSDSDDDVIPIKIQKNGTNGTSNGAPKKSAADLFDDIFSKDLGNGSSNGNQTIIAVDSDEEIAIPKPKPIGALKQSKLNFAPTQKADKEPAKKAAKEPTKKAAKEPAKKGKKRAVFSDEDDDSTPQPKKKAAKKKKAFDSDSDDGDFGTKKKTPKKSTPKDDFEFDEDDDLLRDIMSRPKSGRARKEIKYDAFGSDDDDEF